MIRFVIREIMNAQQAKAEKRLKVLKLEGKP